MGNRFENDSDKQRELYSIIQNWLTFDSLNIIKQSLFLYYENAISKDIEFGGSVMDRVKSKIYGYKDNPINMNPSKEEIYNFKIKLIKDAKGIRNIEMRETFTKVYSLFIVDFSNQWEKNIIKILELCDILSKDNKKREYVRYIEPLIKEHFGLLFTSDIYKDIKTLRKIANEIKHAKLDDSLILDKYFSELLNIEINIMDNEVIWKFEKKKPVKENNEINIDYILNYFKSNINENWVYKEFSFNMQNTVLTNHKTITFTAVVFSDEEKKDIENNPEKYLKERL